jgi:hypothetical protein
MIKEKLVKFKSSKNELPKGSLVFHFDCSIFSFCNIIHNSRTYYQNTRFNGLRILEIKDIFDHLRGDL